MNIIFVARSSPRRLRFLAYSSPHLDHFWLGLAQGYRVDMFPLRLQAHLYGSVGGAPYQVASEGG